ncbi:MAG: M23 family metallopeptidase [bacterium]
MTACAFFLVSACVFLQGCGHSGAAFSYDYSQGYFHRVRAGESLGTIGQLYQRDPQLLVFINGLAPPYSIREGQHLYVPPSNDPNQLSRVFAQRATVIQEGAHREQSEVQTRELIRRRAAEEAARIAQAQAAAAARARSRAQVAASASQSSGRSSFTAQTYRGSGAGEGGSLKDSALPKKYPDSVKKQVSDKQSQDSFWDSPPSGRRVSATWRGRSGYSWPVDGVVIKGFSAGGNSPNKGVNIAAPEGSPVRASRAGTVIYSGDGIPGYGNLVIIDHNDGFATVYAHNRKNYVKTNNRVRQGEVLGEVGDTGNATTVHVHFEIRRNAQTIDPQRYLP